MSYSLHLLGMQESSVNESAEEEFPVDMSGFSEESMFGIDKLSRPSKEGLAAATSAMDQFANATDKAQETDIKLSFHDSFPADNSGFEKDANTEIETEEEFVDSNTIPAHNDEDEQFEDGEDVRVSDVSPEELASDDEDEMLGESATGWDDLF